MALVARRLRLVAGDGVDAGGLRGDRDGRLLARIQTAHSDAVTGQRSGAVIGRHRVERRGIVAKDGRREAIRGGCRRPGDGRSEVAGIDGEAEAERVPQLQGVGMRERPEVGRRFDAPRALPRIDFFAQPQVGARQLEFGAQRRGAAARITSSSASRINGV